MGQSVLSIGAYHGISVSRLIVGVEMFSLPLLFLLITLFFHGKAKVINVFIFTMEHKTVSVKGITCSGKRTNIYQPTSKHFSIC